MSSAKGEGSTIASNSSEKADARTRCRARPQEIDESGAGRRPRLALATVRIVGRRCRVHEPEQRRRIKDAAPSRLGPLSLDEAEQLRFVDVGEAGRLRVQQAEPRDTRPNRKGLPTKPPANG